MNDTPEKAVVENGVEERRDASSTSPPVVLLLHGTWAGQPSPEGQPKRWWEHESSFSAALAESLTIDGRQPQVDAFRWGNGGSNSETIRRAEGERLCHALQTQYADRSVHLIGHSHGGSVIWHALVHSMRNGGSGLGNVASWATVGTPFLRFGIAWHEVLLEALLFVLLSAGIIGVMGHLTGFWDTHTPLSLWHALLERKLGEVLLQYGPATLWWEWPSILANTPRSPAGILASPGSWGTIGLIVTLLILIYTLMERRVAWLARASGSFKVLVLSLLLTPYLGAGFYAYFDQPELFIVTNLLVACICICVLLGLALTLSLGRVLGVFVRQKNEKLAARRYGQYWLGLSHDRDEAILLIQASLGDAPHMALRGGKAGGALSPKQKFLDQGTWRTLTELVQGDDVRSEHLLACERMPHHRLINLRPLPEDVARMTEDIGGELLSQSVHQLWERLLDNAQTVKPDDTDSLWAKLSFRGAIHGAYFDGGGEKLSAAHRTILGMLVGWIRSAPEAVPLVAPQPQPAALERPWRFFWLESGTALMQLFAVAVLVGALYSVFDKSVRPLMAHTQLALAREAWTKGGAFATTDAPVIGAYAVRLAAAGVLDTPETVQAFLSQLSGANQRGVVAQRLAFAFAYADRKDLAQQVVDFAKVRSDPDKDPALFHIRQAYLVNAMRALGEGLKAGKLPEERRAVVASFDRLEKYPKNLLDAPKPTDQVIGPVLNCADTDIAAVTALKVQLLTLAGETSKVLDALGSAARQLDQNCVLPLSSGPLRAEQQDWISTRHIEAAADLSSWGARELAGRLLSMNSLTLPDIGAGWKAEPWLDALRNSMTTRRQACLDEVAALRQLLGTKAKSISAPLPPDPENDWLDTTVPSSQACQQVRSRTIRRLERETDRLGSTKPADKPSFEELLDHLRKTDAVMAYCRVQPPVKTGKLLRQAQRALYHCDQAEKARDLLPVFLRLIGEDKPAAGDLFRKALDSRLLAPQGASLPWRRRLLDIGLRVWPDIAASPAKVASATACNNGQELDKGDNILLCPTSPHYLLKYRPPADSPCPHNNFLCLVDINMYRADAVFMLGDITRVARRNAEAPELAIAGDLDKLEAELVKAYFDDDRKPSSNPSSTPSSNPSSKPSSESTRRPPDCPRKWRELDIDSLPKTLDAIRLARRIEASRGKAFRPNWCQRQSDEAGKSAPIKIKSGLLSDYLMELLAYNRDHNHNPLHRQIATHALVQLHLEQGNPRKARETADGAGTANAMLAAWCQILDHDLRRRQDKRLQEFGLSGGQRWPQPVPVLFDRMQRFSYDDASHGPLTCTPGTEFAID